MAQADGPPHRSAATNRRQRQFTPGTGATIWEEVRATKEQLDGTYYYLDNIGRGLIPARIFGTDRRAIQAAADYEAVLYKYLYKNGQRIATSILYEPGESEEDTEYDD